MSSRLFFFLEKYWYVFFLSSLIPFLPSSLPVNPKMASLNYVWKQVSISNAFGLVDNAILDLHNSSYPAQPHSLIAN